MKRRAFSSFTAVAGLATASSLSLPAFAQAPEFKEGKDYLKLDKPASTNVQPGQVEVVEFFWYNCPHCHSFEPLLAQWAKKQPAHVVFRRVPVSFRADFVPQQKLYYALEGMGKVDELHARVFNAVHVEKKRLTTEAEIMAWIEKQGGIDVAQFKTMYNSFNVANQARRASQLQDAYDVSGVPAMGVAGRWYTDGTQAGSMGAVLQVVESLIAKAPKA